MKQSREFMSHRCLKRQSRRPCLDCFVLMTPRNDDHLGCTSKTKTKNLQHFSPFTFHFSPTLSLYSIQFYAFYLDMSNDFGLMTLKRAYFCEKSSKNVKVFFILVLTFYGKWCIIIEARPNVVARCLESSQNMGQNNSGKTE